MRHALFYHFHSFVECQNVYVYESFFYSIPYSLFPINFCYSHGLYKRSKKHYIHGFWISYLFGYPHSIKFCCFGFLLEFFDYAVGIVRLAYLYWNRWNFIVVYYNYSVGLQMVNPSAGFHFFKRCEYVSLSQSDDRGIYLLPIPDLSGYAASPLRHTMDFGHLYIVPGIHKPSRKNFAGKYRSLSADTYKQNILDFTHIIHPPFRLLLQDILEGELHIRRIGSCQSWPSCFLCRNLVRGSLYLCTSCSLCIFLRPLRKGSCNLRTPRHPDPTAS